VIRDDPCAKVGKGVDSPIIVVHLVRTPRPLKLEVEPYAELAQLGLACPSDFAGRFESEIECPINPAVSQINLIKIT
jgi:hypothetical protein